MSFKKRLAAAMTALATFVVAMVALATPAQAAVYWGCPDGTACVHTDADGGGSSGLITFSGAGTSCHAFAPMFNDTISSASADFGNGYNLHLYRDTGCTNTIWEVTVYSSGSKNFGGTWANDAFSSFRIQMG